jgi:predicted Fe-Mo cluster-binding NifX family protein
MKPFAGKERSSQVKVAFATEGVDLSAPLDSRFGRAAKFLVYNLDTNAFTVIDNQQNLNASQGAGIQSAETVARSGAKAIVTGHCGPKAFRALSGGGLCEQVGPQPGNDGANRGQGAPGRGASGRSHPV